ncbi:hypothetical protein BYT27DRAFT_7210295 [Phlegmacium glaucopus]|nr:hypothetical protein BYT27DRAFT_7210295 [Phlegmacium glaucopus]
MVDRNILVNPTTTTVNQSPATDPKLETTTNSPQLNYDVDENGRQIHKIYHFHNFGTVYMDSLNSHSVTMENCANNNIRRVDYHRHNIMGCLLTNSPRTHRAYLSFSVDYVVMFSLLHYEFASVFKLRYLGKDLILEASIIIPQAHPTWFVYVIAVAMIPLSPAIYVFGNKDAG